MLLPKVYVFSFISDSSFTVHKHNLFYLFFPFQPGDDYQIVTHVSSSDVLAKVIEFGILKER